MLTQGLSTARGSVGILQYVQTELKRKKILNQSSPIFHFFSFFISFLYMYIFIYVYNVTYYTSKPHVLKLSGAVHCANLINCMVYFQKMILNLNQSVVNNL